ncbi:hypothetical protein [Sphingomonas sp. GB1N7]|uniref:hypothetical protein n=1 Tax=Parasphingomonas caseinilytica TaxID=3096158 RepID=UPI002FC5EE61
MSLQSIHLRKLLKILYSDQNRRVSAMRSDIREDIARELGPNDGGGDFYGPFWRDAKDHVFSIADLHTSTKARIDANKGRSNLYPRLRDGFLLWWNERRRWTNEPFRPADNLKSRFLIPDLNSIVKIDNILSVRDSQNEDHFVYPYFSPEPELHDEAARIGLWILMQALPNIPPSEFRILDVIRGKSFSLERNSLLGNEQEIFFRRYIAAIDEWSLLRQEY